MELKFPFEPLRTVQAAAQVVKAAGGRIDCQKLMNILYLADRSSLIETGSPITGDVMFLADDEEKVYGLWWVYWCMWEGWPIRGWDKAFGDDAEFITLESDPGDGELSDYDVDLLQKIHGTYPGTDPSFLPEWKLPKDEVVLRLKPEEVLRAEGFSEEDVTAYQERYAPIAAMDSIRIIR